VTVSVKVDDNSIVNTIVGPTLEMDTMLVVDHKSTTIPVALMVDHLVAGLAVVVATAWANNNNAVLVVALAAAVCKMLSWQPVALSFAATIVKM
jgi:hypothetical protein